MKKHEFIGTLTDNLSHLSGSEVRDIIADYEEHFRMALQEGKAEEEICTSLGSPAEIAAQYQADLAIQEARKGFSFPKLLQAFVAIAGLGLLNLIFVIPLFAVLIGLITGLWAVAIATPFAGIAGVFAIVFYGIQQGTVAAGSLINAAGVFFSFGTFTLGLLMITGMCFLTTSTYKATLNYLQMNLDIIRK